MRAEQSRRYRAKQCGETEGDQGSATFVSGDNAVCFAADTGVGRAHHRDGVWP